MNELLKNALPVAVIVSVPALMALLGILFNQQGLNRLEARMDARFNSMEARFTTMDRRIDELGTKVDRLRDVLHSDVQDLLRLDAGKDVRIARLEERAS